MRPNGNVRKFNTSFIVNFEYWRKSKTFGGILRILLSKRKVYILVKILKITAFENFIAEFRTKSFFVSNDSSLRPDKNRIILYRTFSSCHRPTVARANGAKCVRFFCFFPPQYLIFILLCIIKFSWKALHKNTKLTKLGLPRRIYYNITRYSINRKLFIFSETTAEQLY